MCTTLFSNVGNYRATVIAISNGVDDGFHYKCIETGKISDSQRKAIQNARTYLRKKRIKWHKKHTKVRKKYPKAKRRADIKKVNPIKTINKLFKMEKKVANILVKHSTDKKLKLHLKYAKKKFKKKTTVISGEPIDFSLAIASVMKNGTKDERKAVSKMLTKFVHEPYKKTNMFY